MSVFSVELPDDLRRWVHDRAKERGLTPAQMIEYLVVLESGLRNVDPAGRNIPFRDTLYRQLTPPLSDAERNGLR